MTTFVFRVRNVPAALYKALGGFATNSVNMTKLESYMEGGEFTATQFLADVDGHPERPVARAGAGGTQVLFARSPYSGRLPRASVPERVAGPVELEAGFRFRRSRASGSAGEPFRPWKRRTRVPTVASQK